MSEGTRHLDPTTWATVNERHVRKILSEFAHERLIEPRLESASGARSTYVVATDDPSIVYRFRAIRRALDHWSIERGSIVKSVAGAPTPLDSQELILELARTLEIDPSILPAYLEEVAATLYGAAFKWHHQRHRAGELAAAPFQTIESSMTDGHPCFVANNGRIGFDERDHRAYSPESAAPMRVVWLAGHRSRTRFASVRGLDADTLLVEELGEPTLARFRSSLAAEGLDPAEYVLFPTHPWQWDNKLAIAFSGELASRSLVRLGESEDEYVAQQSIRTLFNTTRPDRRYAKGSLSILNMGFVRGLSPHYMEGTPAINEWVDETLRADPVIGELGFEILREVATAGYRHPAFERATGGDGSHRKMLAALWRESPVPRITGSQRLMTMAALLHFDRDEVPLLRELVEASGIGPDRWLRRYLRAYLTPLLHCYYAHRLVLMPHGENVILVLENHVPVRVFMKDIAEEVAILDTSRVLPEGVRRIAVEVPEELHLLSIFTDVFDCFFRFLAPIFAEHLGFDEVRFWRAVSDCIVDYERKHPRESMRSAHHDLFVARFRLSCLNRLQLRNNRQLLDLADPSKSLRFAGELKNPIASLRASHAEAQETP